MPVAFDEIIAPAPDQPPRRRWTRAECELMASVGLLDGERLELIEGELIQKMGRNNPHVMTVRSLHQWLVAAFGYGRIQKEDFIDVAPEDNESSEPEPDLTVLRAPRGTYRSNPGPPDILLVIEVADWARSFELTKKADLYARARIPDYWVFDTNQREVIVTPARESRTTGSSTPTNARSSYTANRRREDTRRWQSIAGKRDVAPLLRARP